MKINLNCILLIDDDEPTNFINKMLIEEAGNFKHIEVVQGGQPALNYLIKCRNEKPGFCLPDLIFLDINMPAMDGWEFLNIYRQMEMENKKKIIIVMLTTSLNPDDELKAYNMPEVAAFESKPLTSGKLKGIINRYFRQHSSDLI